VLGGEVMAVPGLEIWPVLSSRRWVLALVGDEGWGDYAADQNGCRKKQRKRKPAFHRQLPLHLMARIIRQCRWRRKVLTG